MAGKSGAPWWAHVMLYAGGLTMVVAGGAAAVTQYGVTTANSAFENEEILDDDLRAELDDVQNIEGPLNILVLGTDKDQNGSVRSDTMIMVHVDADLTDVTMVSLPRDLMVDIPDCGPGFSNNPCTNKLNHASSISDDWAVSRANIVQTINDLSGVRFHVAATADFEGFLGLVDLVEEIELCPPHEITSIHTGTVFPGECAYYDQKDALDLVRQRKGWGNESYPEDWEKGWGGDYGRQKMQQQAIKSLLVEAKSQGFHKDPARLSELLNGFGNSLKLDLPDEMKLTDLITNLRDIDPGNLTTVQVPSHPEDIYPNGEKLSVVLVGEGPEQIAADALWQALRDDTVDQWITRHPEWVQSGS